MMMMIIMTLMKLINSGAKFRPGMDKFYQPNSGLRGSKTKDKAIYIYTYVYVYIHVCISTYSISHAPSLVQSLIPTFSR